MAFGGGRLMRALMLMICCCWPTLASAYTVNDVLADRAYATIAVGSAGDAFMWANTALKTRGDQPLFCPPEKLAIKNEQYLDILQRYVQDRPSVGTDSSAVFPYALLRALVEVFPCPPN